MLFNSPSFHDCVFILTRFYPRFHFLISLVLHEVLQIMCDFRLYRSGQFSQVHGFHNFHSLVTCRTSCGA